MDKEAQEQIPEAAGEAAQAPLSEIVLPMVTIAYDVSICSAFSRFCLRKMWSLLLVGLLGFALAVLSGVKLWLDFNVGSLLWMLFGLLLTLTYPILYALVPVLVKKGDRLVKLQNVTTLILGEKVTDSATSNNGETFYAVYEWAVFVSAAENEKYFFLMREKGSGYPIRKSDLKNCTVEEFRDLLKSKLGARCKIKHG